MHFEKLPENYYRSCGGFTIQQTLYQDGGLCVFQQHTYVAVLSYKCMLYSMFYESRRPPGVQEKFGRNPLRAIILAITPLQIFIAALGTLNLIIMREVQKGVDKMGGGTLIYHQMQIGSDVVAALLAVSPDFVALKFYANDVFHAFSGAKKIIKTSIFSR